VPGTYTVSEFSAPAGYKGEAGSKSVPSSTQSCAGRKNPTPDAQAADVQFDNIPLSTIRVVFTSLAEGANGDATVASINCAQGGTGVPAENENGSSDPATRDDLDETYGNGTATLLPGVYDCTVDIDP